MAGRNFYRLKSVDLDGRTDVFPMQHINFDAAVLPPIIFLSNPVRNGKLDFMINAKGIYELNVWNGQGQKIFAKNINNTTAGSRYSISFPYTLKGICILNLVNSEQQYTFKFLVQ